MVRTTPYLLSKRRNMVDLKKIHEKLEPIIQEHELELVNLRWDKMGHQKVLEISLQNQDKTLDLDQASAITKPISDALDELDELDFEYLLDIGSPGVERILETKEDLINHLEDYINVDFTDKSRESIQGTLLEVMDDSIKLKYFIKGRPKKETIALKDIETIHIAVKF